MSERLCKSAHRFIDGELSTEQSAAYRLHLAECVACQRETQDAFFLAYMSERVLADVDPALELGRAATAAPRWRRRLVWSAVPVLVAAAAVVLFWRGSKGIDEGAAAEPAIELAKNRSTEARFADASLDAHRPYAVLRSEDGAGERTSAAALAALEKNERWSALAGAHALNGNLASARRVAAKLVGRDGDISRAALAIIEGRPREALVAADAALALDPLSAAARWNRALALRDLHLPLSAAVELEALAELGEIGWAGEARDLAAMIRASYERRLERWSTVLAASEAFAANGEALSAQTARSAPAVAADAVYSLLSRAPSKENLAAGRIVSDAIGDAALDRFLDRVAAADAPLRSKLARAGQLLGRKSAEHTEATIKELRALAGGLGVGWIEAAAIKEETYWLLYIGRRYERALAVADASGEVCRDPLLAARCDDIAAMTGTALATLGRSGDSIEALDRVRATSLRDGNLSLENSALYRLGESLLDSRSDVVTHSLGRAYLAEERLRAPRCKTFVAGSIKIANWEVRNGQWSTAKATLEQARARARAECPEFINTVGGLLDEALIAGALDDRAYAVDVAARIDEELPNTVAEVRGDLELARAMLSLQIDPRDGERRLEAIADVATADGRTAMGLLALADARGAKWKSAAERMQLAPCELAVLLEHDAALVAMAADGEASGAVISTNARELSATNLVPAALLSTMGGCEVIEVLAYNRFYGEPGLIPRELAWHYRSPSRSGPKRSPAAAEALFVVNVEPPPELHLATLLEMTPPSDGRAIEGAAATPEAVLRAFEHASYIEIHAHGVTTATGINYLVLSPDRSGQYALTATDLRQVTLAGRPVVILAACDVGKVGGEPWGLAEAFIAAGASAVIASPAPVADREAPAFFARLRAKNKSVDLSAALRDTIAESKGSRWSEELLLFR